MGCDILKLRDFLEGIRSGPIPESLQDDLREHVAACWGALSGSDDSAMATYKLVRMEDPKWSPPILTFTIERHGGTVLGSTRAGLQQWELNLDEETASCSTTGYRQLSERAKTWRAEPVAEELAHIVVNGHDDPRLEWVGEGRKEVSVLTPSVIPDYHSSPKDTLDNRRRRFFKAMETALIPAGWKRTRNRFKKC